MVTAGSNKCVKVNDQCFLVPEVLEPPEPRFGAWQPPVSSPLPVYPLQTPSGGWPAPPTELCDYGGFRPVHLPCGSAEPSHHVPTKKQVRLSFTELYIFSYTLILHRQSDEWIYQSPYFSPYLFLPDAALLQQLIRCSIKGFK